MGGMNIINTTLSQNNLEGEIQAAISGLMLREAASHHSLEQEVGITLSHLTDGETEESLDDTDDKINFAGNFSPRTSYSFHEEEFRAGLQYKAPALDYEKLWYGERQDHSAEYALNGEYVSEMPSGAESDMLTVQEAAETFMDIQYHALLGNVYEVNGEERRKFNLWIAFNPALFKLFESLQGLTRDVNYAMN